MNDTEKQLLRPIVNDPAVWKVLDSTLLRCYNNKQKELERLVPIEDIYKAQGYIQAITYLRELKANVNVK